MSLFPLPSLNEPPQQSAAIQALHRHFLLKDAREIIIDHYNFTIGQLRLEGYDTRSQHRAALVGAVRAKLSPEDGALLSDNALVMIFDRWTHSVRDDGNDAAHRGSEGPVSLAVLGADLSDAQRESLQQIYKFTHDTVPQLELDLPV